MITASCSPTHSSSVHFNSLSVADSTQWLCRLMLWWEGREYKWKWLHINTAHIISVNYLTVIMAKDQLSSPFCQCSCRTVVVVSSSEGASEDFHHSSCLAAIFTAPRPYTVSTRAVFQKRSMHGEDSSPLDASQPTSLLYLLQRPVSSTWPVVERWFSCLLVKANHRHVASGGLTRCHKWVSSSQALFGPAAKLTKDKSQEVTFWKYTTKYRGGMHLFSHVASPDGSIDPYWISISSSFQSISSYAQQTAFGSLFISALFLPQRVVVSIGKALNTVCELLYTSLQTNKRRAADQRVKEPDISLRCRWWLKMEPKGEENIRWILLAGLK